MKFWEEFHRSGVEHFLPERNRQFFVFTDHKFPPCRYDDVTVIAQEPLGWPQIVLSHFHILGRALPQLRHFDHVFSFNVNCRFHTTIDERILPAGDQELVVTQHPCFPFHAPDMLPYERDKRSTAFIPPGSGEHYVCGAVKGGTVAGFAAMVEALRTAVDRDEARGIAAIWHDESHLNRYIIGRHCRILHPGYCYPEERLLPFPKMIEVRDKVRHGGHDFMRGLSDRPRRDWSMHDFTGTLKTLGSRFKRTRRQTTGSRRQ